MTKTHSDCCVVDERTCIYILFNAIKYPIFTVCAVVPWFLHLGCWPLKQQAFNSGERLRGSQNWSQRALQSVHILHFRENNETGRSQLGCKFCRMSSPMALHIHGHTFLFLQTSIMAVAYADGVVIGADSRTTTGAYIANRVTDKLTKVHDRIYCCRSGSAADTQAVADIVHYYLQLYRYAHPFRLKPTQRA